jgi:uncharacterized protein YjiS (DUF1127 family)
MTKMFSLAAGPSQASGVFSGNLVGRFTGLLVTWQQRATLRYRLAQLDGRQLADMGLAPAQAMDEASKPFWRA